MSGARLARRLAGLACAVAACVLAAPAGAHSGAPMWSIGAVMSRIDGAKVVIGRWSARVQADTTLCNGEGLGRRWGGVRHWRHFTCTWTVFDRKGPPRPRRHLPRTHARPNRFRLTDARFGAS
jgi:hypothetical protein